MVAALCFDGVWVAISLPDDCAEWWDNFHQDNPFDTDNLPTQCGVYELNCVLYWEDGHMPICEQTESEWRVTVTAYKPIWVSANN